MILERKETDEVSPAGDTANWLGRREVEPRSNRVPGVEKYSWRVRETKAIETKEAAP